ncbi:hypothetical protein [Rhodococcus qingshengii]|uniref:GTP pyrophosphokinase n=1 Tax=Rhodococcus qingshengii TaxID=334542 RepID=UPI00301797F1
MRNDDAARTHADHANTYDLSLPMYQHLADVVKEALEETARNSGIKMHSVVVRVKEKSSFLEKIPRKGYVDPFTQTTDIVAARLVCLFVDDLPRLDSILRRKFRVIESEDKENRHSFKEFGYSSVHYICELGSKFKEPLHDEIQDIRFEIQCRTILMDAWASVDHYLAYKGSTSIPPELQRDLSALRALFHIADKQFQQLGTAVLDSEMLALKLGETNLNEARLNRSTLKALLHDMFTNRDKATDADYSELVEQLNACGYKNLAGYTGKDRAWPRSGRRGGARIPTV